MIALNPRAKKCKACGEKFTPSRPMQSACSIPCALELGKKNAKRVEKKLDKVRREKLKTRSDYIKEAQIAFNRYVRLRDSGRPCVCCGRSIEPGGVGGGADAGHYRSVGSAPHLRFNEDNCHAQSKQCNRYGAGRAVDYRIGLVERIGLPRVEALEADNSLPKWSIDELKAIRGTYRAKAHNLEKKQ